MEKTYKDFKIGQKVHCYSLDREFDSSKGVPDKEFWEQHLTPGKDYIIEDVDWHFPDKIVVKSDNGKLSQFTPISFFVSTLQEERDDKINQILDEN